MRPASGGGIRCEVCGTPCQRATGHCPLCGSPVEVQADGGGDRAPLLDAGDDEPDVASEVGHPNAFADATRTDGGAVVAGLGDDLRGVPTPGGSPGRAGPLMWEGRVTLPAEQTMRRRRRGLMALLVGAVGGLSGLLLCHALIQQLLAGMIGVAVVAAVVVALLASFRVTRWTVLIIVKAMVAVGHGLVAASLATARGGRESDDVLVVRLDVGGSREVTVAVDGVAKGVRQGDRVRAVGPSMLGTVRPLMVRNPTTGLLVVGGAARRAVTATGLLTGIVVLTAVMC